MTEKEFNIALLEIRSGNIYNVCDEEETLLYDLDDLIEYYTNNKE